MTVVPSAIWPGGVGSVPRRIDVISVLTYIAIMSIFTAGFLFRPAGSFDIHLSYIVILLTGPVLIYLARHEVPWGLAVVAGAILGHGVVAQVLGGGAVVANLPRFLAQWVGIVGSFYFFWLIFRVNNFDVVKLVGIYMNCAFWIAVLGLVQFFSFILGIEFLYDYDWFIPEWSLAPAELGLIRINAIMTEPSHLTMVLLPASGIAIYSILYNVNVFVGRRGAAVILACMFGTFSTTAYFGMLVVFALLFMKRLSIFRIVGAVALVGLLGYGAYATSPEFQSRIEDTFRAFAFAEVEGANVTTLTTFNNGYIALEAFLETRGVGTGLGTHQYNFDRFGLLPPHLSFNSNDAASLLFRLMSEMGAFGVILVIYLLAATRRGISTNMILYNMLWCVMFAYFVTNFIRGGQYFTLGMPLFYWTMVFLGRQARAYSLVNLGGGPMNQPQRPPFPA